MKQNTAKRSSSGMRFFTPELYLRFNSDDEDVADQAMKEWEVAITEYQQHLDTLVERFPPRVAKLAESNYHDADVIELRQDSIAERPGELSDVFTISIRTEYEVTILTYFLWDEPREVSPKADWPFPHSRDWLYDEIDAEPQQGRFFWHRIFLSNGKVLHVPFTNVLMNCVATASLSASNGTLPLATTIESATEKSQRVIRVRKP